VPSTVVVSRADDNWKVGQANDHSLRAAIHYAAGGDTVVFAAGISSIHLTQGEILIDKSLQIVSPIPNNVLGLAIVGSGSSRVFEIGANCNVEFQGLAITGGKQTGDGQTASSRQGGGILNHGNLNLNTVLLADNKVIGDAHGGGQGGGLYNDDGNVEFENFSVVASNTATGPGNTGEADDGGGIFNYRGVIFLEYTNVDANFAQGGMGHGAKPAGGDAYGGGIFNLNGSVFMNYCTVSDNTAKGGGRPSFAVQSESVNSGQGGSAFGGGIYSSGGMAQLSNVVIKGNEAVGGLGGDVGTANGGSAVGGGIEVGNGALTLTRCEINNNKATGGDGGNTWGNGGNAEGGGVDFYGVTKDLTIDAEFDGNWATGGTSYGGNGGDGQGGGMWVLADNLQIPSTGGAITGNYAVGGDGGQGGAGGRGQGGGMFLQVKSAKVLDENVSGNQAIGGLGGAGGLLVENSTFMVSGPGGQGGDGEGGGVYLKSGNLTVGYSASNGVVGQWTSNNAKGGRGGDASNGQISGKVPDLNGGIGGHGQGGAIYSDLGNITIRNILVQLNTANGGNGGQGGSPGQGALDQNQSGMSGPGGEGAGGGVFVGRGALDMKAVDFESNSALGGDESPINDTTPVNGTSVGHGGLARGGAFYTTGDTLLVTGTVFGKNLAWAGRGGDVPDGGASAGDGGEADGGAGYVYLNNANAKFYQDTFEGNQAAGGNGGWGAAGKIQGVGGRGGDAYGGALVVAADHATIDSTGFDSNWAGGGDGGNGGAFNKNVNPDLPPQGSRGSDGGSAWGGAVVILGGSVTLVGNSNHGLIQSNSAIGGFGGDGGDALPGGIGGNPGNGGSAYGGAIASMGGEAFLLMEEISGNKALGAEFGHVGAPGPILGNGGIPPSFGNSFGGGLYLFGNDSVEVLDSTFNMNFASAALSEPNSNKFATVAEGGGLYDAAGTLLITNSTLAQNSADYYGGGLYNENGVVTLTNDTIAYNQADAGGGVFTNANTTLVNTLIAKNSTGSPPDPDFYAGKPSDITDGAHNLIGVAGQSVGNAFSAKSDLVGTQVKPLDPMIGQLAYNGGPTETIALLPGSKAINAGLTPVKDPITGQNLSFDQRGVFRPSGGKNDIGAFEVAAAPLNPQGQSAMRKILFPGLLGKSLFSAFLLDLLPISESLSDVSHARLTRTLIAMDVREIEEILGAADAPARFHQLLGRNVPIPLVAVGKW
jgi:hypothetical protein